MKFKQYLNEQQALFVDYRALGWWKDVPTYFFHGTRQGIWDSIEKVGSLVPTQSKQGNLVRVHGKVFLALDPFTARGYSVMGGEAEFKRQTHPNPEKYGQRIVIVFKFDDVNSFIPSGRKKEKLLNRNMFDKYIEENGERMAWKYYELTEVFTNNPVSLDNIVEIIQV